MRNLLLGFVLGLLVATGAGVWAQSSQTLGQDLQNLKTSIIYCLNDNNGWMRDARGYTIPQAKPQALKWCEDKALAVYKQRAESEERLIEAEQAYKKALSTFRRIPGQNYETTVVLRNLGSIYALDGRDSEALKVLNEGSKLIKKNLPNERILAAQILNSLGTVYFRQGKMSKAETLLAQAIEIASAAGVDSDGADAQILNNLGAVYQRQRK